jgi:hypothetical protein
MENTHALGCVSSLEILKEIRIVQCPINSVQVNLQLEPGCNVFAMVWMCIFVLNARMDKKNWILTENCMLL